jgi:hypothetical protein
MKAFLRFFIKAKIIRGTASIVKATKSTATVTLVLVLLISSVIYELTKSHILLRV